MDTILYNNKPIRVLDEADVIVVGGGTAGVVAAISTLNEGKSCIIIEKTNALCGTATNAMVIPFMYSHVCKKDGLNVALNEEYKKFDPDLEFTCNNNAIAFANPITMAMFYDLKIRQLNGKLYYDATFIDCLLDDNNKITYAIAFVHNELVAFKATCYVDCSAEGLLAKAANCELMSGDETRNHIHQASSLRFEMANVDKVKLVNWLKEIHYKGFGIPSDSQDIEFIGDPSYRKIVDEAIQNGEVTAHDMRSIQAFHIPGKPGYFAWNGPQLSELMDTTDPKVYSDCISEGYKAIARYSNFFIHHIPGFENAFVSTIASQLGVRESVRVKTKYILIGEDYSKRARFEDGIAKADWYVDVHADDLGKVDNEMYQPGEYYEIPYRSLITDQCPNLIVGGRIVGASFKVEASVRIQVTLRDISEVIGKACAYSIDNHIDLNKINGKVFKSE